ncbi:hypothetical protein [Isoptericola croceus]|uniref:hypothetical protein n=1 Tax=Isoptericola croceus TaxID=3031406 RepID=UPI0023F7AA1B|nr:hypothetical protein [Isoptericola croceus]
MTAPTPAMMPRRTDLLRVASLGHAVPSGRRGLLVDLENFLHCTHTGGWVSAQDADRRLRRVLDVEADFRLGVCAPGLVASYLGRSSVVGADVLPLRVCPNAPDAADRMLLEVAEHLLSVGFTAFTVASGDHAFCELAERADLDVVVANQHALSGDLAACATTVRVLA